MKEIKFTKEQNIDAICVLIKRILSADEIKISVEHETGSHNGNNFESMYISISTTKETKGE